MPLYPETFDSYIESEYETLVRILETPNPPEGEEKMRALVKKELKNLGMKTSIDSAGNLIGHLGKGENAFLLGGHLDSVQPCEGIKVRREGDIIKSEGETILSADNGVGIFEIMAALKYLHDNKLPYCPVDILFTVGEEIGGIGAQAVQMSDLRAKHGMLLDRSDDPGVLVVEGPYKRNFSVTFTGVSAHAFEAEKGVSAIHMAAACISLFPQGKIHDGLYANIGRIQGGNAVNQVAENAVLEGEVRALTKEGAEKLLEEYQRIIDSIQYKFSLSGEFSPTAEFKHTARREGYKHDEEDWLIKNISSVQEKLGIPTKMQVTRACSDAGDLTNRGINTVNYGNGAHRVHTKDEWVDMKDIKTASWFLVNFLQEIKLEDN
ncbi:M20/M25/M40 family metallo-hydrolase [Candidatus Peregrinibacteria bacterium]|jgi:tripeptide aminopeptidase|nr:M20/M25/M40 family metallo-hydrolase [Candidatus Peregrinibacteria bacterium]MBT3598225.1 M20/M25/M40 family metallo-hydrolase [Candidatus Peregrinibacteria bacterium]MBT4367149.1 M20/M25/M40 family metallo-hydrolase [Candidatus Peregrinibacteria bacterium]MBT4585807.1 M20/M25/M40 family metallo-hydrolase [Candidatus Peregrinibacteria bacterium]MBT6730933.1 M20/M25/M40 family metallo-hydrolase [Candidatus Peregrinibacteria bacterium]